MATIPQCKIVLPQRVKLLTQTPLFQSLPRGALENLASNLSEESFEAEAVIVKEGEEGNKFYVIARGRAEVTTQGPEGAVTLATLEEGETFGELALIGPTHKRQANVQAVTPMSALTLGDQEFETLISQYPIIKTQIELNAQTLLIAKFLKQATPFAKLDAAAVKKLAQKLKKISAKPGEIIIRQGDRGDSCYLLREGRVEITTKDNGSVERKLAVLEKGALIGETALLTEETRNATIRAIEYCELLALNRNDLMEVMGAEAKIGSQIFEVMQLRARPKQKIGILLQHHKTLDQENVVTLKDPECYAYFRLSRQGFFIWRMLDGQHNIRDLTLEYLKTFGVFAPQNVVEIVGQLLMAGFARTGKLRQDTAKLSTRGPLWMNIVLAFSRLMTWTLSWKNIDQRLAKVYSSGINKIYAKPSQIALASIAIAGLIAFIFQAQNFKEFFKQNQRDAILLLWLAPVYMATILIHEAGHAFTVKAFGREVPRVGIGWYWFGPIAFVDTSDMWLAPRWQRVAVSFAGPYSTVILASLAALVAHLWPTPGLTQAFWILALILYALALFNLNPLLEYDGYYMLMDGLDFPNLRSRSFAWLGTEFPKVWRNPRILKSHRVELIYSLGSIVFMAVLALALVYFYAP